MKHGPIHSNFISALPAGKRTVGVTNPPLALDNISFLLQEYNWLPNSEFFFAFLIFLDKMDSQLPPNSELRFLNLFTWKLIKCCLKHQLTEFNIFN